MLEWLTSNIGTILIVLALIAVIAAIVVKMIKDKKGGKSSCGCNCGCCPMSGECHKSN